MKKGLFAFWTCLPLLVFGQVDTAGVEREVDSLIKISRSLTGQGNFEQAFATNESARSVAERALGKQSPAFASCQFNQGRVLFFQKKYAAAEPFYLEAKDIRQAALGGQHPDFALSLNALGALYQNMNRYADAEKCHLQAKQIREKVLGKEHSDYLQSLNNLALLYFFMTRLEESLALYVEAKEIAERTMGNQSPAYAASLNSVAAVLSHLGKLDEAERWMLEGLQLRENLLGRQHPDFIRSLYNLGAHYNIAGRFESAERVLTEAIALQDKVLGKNNLDFAQTQHTLSAVLWASGRLEEAEANLLESRSIREQLLGKTHLDYANSTQSLAALYLTMGRPEAERFALEAKTIFEKTVGKKHPGYASALETLQLIYQAQGRFDAAEACGLEGKAIREELFGKQSLEMAISTSNLANLYLTMNRKEAAEPLLLESLGIAEKILGREHPDFAKPLNILGRLHLENGNYAQAETLLSESKSIREKTLGKTHPDYLTTLLYLAEWSARQARRAAVSSLCEEVVRSYNAELAKAAQFLSEPELAARRASRVSNFDFCFSLARQTDEAPALLGSYFDHALFQKGFLLGSAIRLNVLAAANPATADNFYRLKSYHRRLATEYAKPLADRKNVPDLEAKANELEKDLVRSVAGYGEAIRQVTWQEVQAALGEREAAVEFVHFRKNFPQASDSVVYAALVLRPGWEAPRWVGLFEEKQVQALLQTKKSGSRADEVNATYFLHPSKPNLHDLIWRPLAQLLASPSEAGGDVETVYFSPSGLLHRLNLEAIASAGRPVSTESADRSLPKFVQLGSTRQLVSQPAAAMKNDLAAVFGGVRYDMDSVAIAKANAALPLDWGGTRGAPASGGIGFANADSTLRGGDWNYLQWTEVEALSLDKLLKNNGLQPQTHRGYAATEEAFKALSGGSSPRILHLATHGFFFPDPKSEISNPKSGSEPVFKLSEHPMIRSGLILAGGNHAWKTGKPLQPGMEDGILTAYEISQMNLSSTELVVLSACETGLGELQGNEGVYGLQRAFKIAGVKYVLMSLWQVPDFQTQELMSAFYAHWLEGKMDIPDAFRAAQGTMRERYAEPFFWAGFVLVE